MKKTIVTLFCAIQLFPLLATSKQKINTSNLLLLARQEHRWMILLGSIAGKEHYGLLGKYTKQKPSGLKAAAEKIDAKTASIYSLSYLLEQSNRQKGKKSNLIPQEITIEENLHTYFPLWVEYVDPKKLHNETPQRTAPDSSPDRTVTKPKTEFLWFPLRQLMNTLQQEKGCEESSFTLNGIERSIDPVVKTALTSPQFVYPRKDRS